MYQRGRIVLQYVRHCSPTFSGALLAHLEATLDGDERKNAMSVPVPAPDVPLDWLRMQLIEALNQSQWMQSPSIRAWLAAARLDGFSAPSALATGARRSAYTDTLERLRQARKPALERMTYLLNQVSTNS